ncbi:hypothetical protein CDAR_230261 [Caerostris darwini]|uniref:Uncharacterized protein n=1 Tax=Caerostris darwini TaxID=1538125 RepID=A0AAV4MKV9_9ARAC|nr:hypothetical protein CDAR_230261 [Caerostris darwini]
MQPLWRERSFLMEFHMKEQLLIMRPPFSTKHTEITAPLMNIREVILGYLGTGWKEKRKETANVLAEDEQKEEKKSNNYVSPGIQRWPGNWQQQQKQFSPLAFQRSENEACATTLRRTHSWRSFHYLLGPVIERNKRRRARRDMIQKIRARRRLRTTRGASTARVAAVD